MGTRALGLAILLATFTPPRQTAPVLVELFTSEGCSSCPPADALLIELAKSHPNVVALGEHVDYWDQLGWRDAFSKHDLTVRQNAYGDALKVPDIYTPQVIVDGAAQMVGSDRAAVEAAIAKAAAAPKAVITLTWTSATSLTLDLAAGSATRGAEMWLAVTEDGLTSQVTRGENQGRQLAHAAVTRELRRVGKTDSSGAFHGATTVAFDRSWHRDQLHVVVVAQKAGGPVVALGAGRPGGGVRQ